MICWVEKGSIAWRDGSQGRGMQQVPGGEGGGALCNNALEERWGPLLCSTTCGASKVTLWWWSPLQSSPDELGSPVPSAGTITCIPERCSSVKLSLPTTGPFSISANPELQGGWIQGEPEVLEMAKTFTPDYFLVVHQIK